MPRRTLLATVALLACLLLPVGAAAQYSKAPADWIKYGDDVWRMGYPQSATPYYNWAYGLANSSYDPYAMIALADRYLRLRNEGYALDTFAKAQAYAAYWMRFGGQYYAYGYRALQSMIDAYNGWNTSRLTTQVSVNAQQQLRTAALAASGIVMAQARQSAAPGAPTAPAAPASPNQPSTGSATPPLPPDWDPWADLRYTDRTPR